MDWRDKLKTYKQETFGDAARAPATVTAEAKPSPLLTRNPWARPKSPAPASSPSPKIPSPAEKDALVVLLGIDFGTSFTKVVWRDWGGDDRYGVVRLDAEAPFRPSVVWRDEAGRLYLDQASDRTGERWLKMRLAEPSTDNPQIADLIAMSVFFVGSTIRDAKTVVGRQFPDNVITWGGGAMGYPAAYRDEAHREVFERVAAAAWAWAEEPSAPTDLAGLRQWCQTTWPDAAKTNFEVRPEVIAAVDCFTMRPDASSGVYIFLDVGGGTLDGACFRLDRTGAGTKVFLFASKVEPLGIELAAKVSADQWAPKIGRWALESLRGAAQPLQPDWRWLQDKLFRFMGGLIMAGKRGENWLALPDQRPAAWRSLADQIDDARHLPIFFGGGGMACAVYRDCAGSVWGQHEMGKAGVPKLAVGQFAPPRSDWPNETEFHRCAVAYGLTRPTDQAGDWHLQASSEGQPSSFQSRIVDTNGVDHEQNRDAYD